MNANLPNLIVPHYSPADECRHNCGRGRKRLDLSGHGSRGGSGLLNAEFFKMNE